MIKTYNTWLLSWVPQAIWSFLTPSIESCSFSCPVKWKILGSEERVSAAWHYPPLVYKISKLYCPARLRISLPFLIGVSCSIGAETEIKLAQTRRATIDGVLQLMAGACGITCTYIILERSDFHIRSVTHYHPQPFIFLACIFPAKTFLMQFRVLHQQDFLIYLHK